MIVPDFLATTVADKQTQQTGYLVIGSMVFQGNARIISRTSKYIEIRYSEVFPTVFRFCQIFWRNFSNFMPFLANFGLGWASQSTKLRPLDALYILGCGLQHVSIVAGVDFGTGDRWPQQFLHVRELPSRVLTSFGIFLPFPDQISGGGFRVNPSKGIYWRFFHDFSHFFRGTAKFLGSKMENLVFSTIGSLNSFLLIQIRDFYTCPEKWMIVPTGSEGPSKLSCLPVRDCKRNSIKRNEERSGPRDR